MRLGLCAAVAALFGLLLGQASPVYAQAADERILSAREAATRADIPRLGAMAALPTDHVLEPYVAYWWLAARVARISEPLPPEDVRGYLMTQDGTWLAEKLRGEWLKRLARESQWSVFAEEYPRLQQPDQELQCHYMAARSLTDVNLLAALQAQWLTLLDVPEPCQPILEALVVSGRVSQEDVVWRVRRLIENRRLSAARMAAGWARQSLDSPAMAAAFDNPSRFLASPAGRSTASAVSREAIVTALIRLARTDLSAAQARWRVLDEHFPSIDRAYIAGQFGWLAAQAQQGDALGWFRQAGGIPMGEEQRAWQARAALRSGDWAALREAIEAMGEAQRNQPDWVYWQGRALAAQGRKDEAAAQYQRIAGEAHFYGMLAAEALGRRFSFPRGGTPVSVSELAAVRELPGLRRTVALLQLDLRTEALREWSWLLRGADDRSLLALAETMRQQGFYDRAIAAADRTRQQHDYGLRYLAPFYDSFAPQARANGLDLAWVYGLVRQESRFVPAIRSSAGAQGLMQVMPATGKYVAKKIDMDDYSASALSQVTTNVKIGTAYLRMVYESLGNSQVVASAAYNAGPGRARRWRDARPMEGAIYAETIPFTETRDYVKKVMANAVAYATLFDGKSASLTSRLGVIQPGGAEQVAENLP